MATKEQARAALSMLLDSGPLMIDHNYGTYEEAVESLHAVLDAHENVLEFTAALRKLASAQEEDT